MRKTFDQIRTNSGQATVEYILLLVVVVALLLGPLKQFSQMFSGYMDALYGNGGYIACLLETGELGGQSTDAGSSCSAQLQSSVQAAISKSQAGGATSGSGSGSGSNSSNGSSSSSQDSSDSSSTSKKSPTTSVASDGAGTTDAGGEGAAGGANSAFNNVGVAAGANQRNRPPSQQVVKGGAAGGGSEDSYVKGDGGTYDYKNLKPKSGFEVSTGRFDRRFDAADAEAVRAEKIAPKEVSSTNTKNLRAKELTFDPPRAPAAKDEDTNTEGFGFSVLLKWFLIAGILIALFVVLGGQALQISKSGDN